MKVNRRTVILLIVVVIVIVGVYAITRWQQGRETRDLLALLHSPDHGKAIKAMAGLRERGSSIEHELIHNLKVGNKAARWRAAVLLGSVPTAAAKQALQNALTDDYDDVRMDAAMALGKLGATEAAEKLGTMVTDEDEETPVRTAALRALVLLKSGAHVKAAAELAKAWPPQPPSEEEIAAGAEVPPDDTAQLRATAVAALGVLGAVADEKLPDQVKDSSGRSGATTAESALMVLKESTVADKEPNADVRRQACYAIADLAAAKAEDKLSSDAARGLISALDDESGNVRLAATYAIGLMSIPEGVQDEVARAIEKAANDDHYWVREAAQETASRAGLSS
jgi:HEAT repeat protein